MAGKFELYRDKAGEYRFRLKAGNGQTIGASEGYTAKSGAENGIESVKTNCTDMNRYTIFEGKSGKYYFNLKAKNGQVILSSQGYESEQGAQNGCESVSRHAPDAPVVEVE
ncbi:MAG: YegP family protein [Oceanospirillales bacterium]|nr:YegP family protein [Oceanospirillales bacterium]